MDPMDLEECGKEEHCYCDVPTYYQGLELGLDVSGLGKLNLDDLGLDDLGLDDPSSNEVSDGFFSRKSEKKPNCQPDKKPSCPKACPKSSKPSCPKPSKPACPKPASKPSCPKPASKPSCPKPASKPACPSKPASSPSCSKPSKPACPPASACKRRQDRKHPKLPRSRNPFIIFFLSLYFKNRCRKVTDVARDAGKKWCSMSPKDKEQYRKLAKAEQKRQQRKHCGSRRKSRKCK